MIYPGTRGQTGSRSPVVQQTDYGAGRPNVEDIYPVVPPWILWGAFALVLVRGEERKFSLRKTLSVPSAECERCTEPVRLLSASHRIPPEATDILWTDNKNPDVNRGGGNFRGEVSAAREPLVARLEWFPPVAVEGIRVESRSWRRTLCSHSHSQCNVSRNHGVDSLSRQGKFYSYALFILSCHRLLLSRMPVNPVVEIGSPVCYSKIKCN